MDRLKEVLGGLEQAQAEPEGDDKDLISELERMAMAVAKDEPKPAKSAAGTLVAQTLERPLRPGESVAGRSSSVLFRETEMELPAIVAKPKARNAQGRGAEARQAAKTERKSFDEDEKHETKVANQSIRVHVDTLEKLMTMVSSWCSRATSCSRSRAATRTPNSRCRCSASRTSPPSCRKA
jgi:two-component system chemotaxis sensor kinase CheA